MIIRLLLYIACILPYSVFCQTCGIGQPTPSSSIGRTLSMQHKPKGDFTRLHTYTSDDGRQYRDDPSRLTGTDYLKNGRYRTNAYGTRYTYDIMGNAMSVRRNGLLDDGTYGPIDDLTLQYDGNRLTKVTDAAEGPYRKDAMHYVDGADAQEEFAYDANGNMTRNLDRHICSIQYNSLNLPRRIEFTDGSIVRYTYTATGEKLRTDYHVNPLAASASAGMDAPRVDSTSLVHTWRTYTGNRIYDNDSLSMLLVDGADYSNSSKYRPLSPHNSRYL